MIIRPLTDPSRHAVGGDCYPSAANFPWMKMCWLFDTVEANGRCTDVVSNVVAGDAGNTANTIAADGTMTLGATKNVLVSGTIPVPLPSSYAGIVLISIGKPSASQGTGTIGTTAAISSGTPAFRSGVAAAAGPSAIADGSSLFTVAAGLAGTGTQMQARLTTFNYTGNMVASDFDGTTWVDRAATDLTLPTAIDMSTIGQALNLGSATSRPALFMVGYFSTMPAAAILKMGTEWMHAMAIADPSGTPRHWIFPGFRNLAA